MAMICSAGLDSRVCQINFETLRWRQRTEAMVSVQINGVKADVVLGSVTGVSVRAIVPPDLPPSDSAVVTVITDAGVPANQDGVLAIVRDPVANPLLAGQTVTAGASFTLTGAWNPGPHGVTVLVNDVAAGTANATGNAVTVTVPPATKPGPARWAVPLDVGGDQPEAAG
jgi:hypothetical protein